jgi:hypothetical protein
MSVLAGIVKPGITSFAARAVPLSLAAVAKFRSA